MIRNVRDLKEIHDNIKDEMEIKSDKWIDEVLDIVLTVQPVPWEKDMDDEDKVLNRKNKRRKKTLEAH